MNIVTIKNLYEQMKKSIISEPQKKWRRKAVHVENNLEGDGEINFVGGGWEGSNNNTGTVTHTSLNTTP